MYGETVKFVNTSLYVYNC